MTPIGKTAVIQNSIGVASQGGIGREAQEERLREISGRLEASFLSEMLKHAGVGETPSAFGGGAGEDQFASFLRQAQADTIVAGGGIGLAEKLFQALTERSNGNF